MLLRRPTRVDAHVLRCGLVFDCIRKQSARRQRLRQCFVDCSRTLLRGRGRLHGTADVDANIVTKFGADSTTHSYADSNAHVKMMANGVHYIAGSPPLGNKFYHEARTEAEDRMAMRTGGGSGRITPPQAAALNPQAAAYRPPRPAPPGLKKTEQQTEAPRTVVEVEVE